VNPTGGPPLRLGGRAERRDAACYNDEMAGERRKVPVHRRVWLVVDVVMVVLVIVAAGTGLPSDIRDGVANGSDIAMRALVGGLAGAAVGVGLILGVRRAGVATKLGLASAMAAALAVFTIAALGATASVSMAPLHPDVRTVEPVESVGPAEASPDGTSSGGESGATDLPGWVEAALVVIAIVVSIFLLSGAARSLPSRKRRRRGVLGRRNRRESEAVHEDLDVEAAADVFERAASLGDGPDPRVAIIAAYARLLDGLGDVGCARRPHEAPEEHLRRSLGTLGVPADHMQLVVDKFLVARFSTHPLTNSDADAVRSALREVGTQLRESVRRGETAMAATT
jgi:hypothetical protein